eukprot:TRINITY_DN1518_c0_g2_i1.p1 TRINITY_DN1518_c0_g2~~TRINITY_DN1518_c0_g2_i1.p1  ORF type:complete len:555 (+),score=119.45 TRINITY_DN1518_c0_g2_i1:113-1777(+)
MTSAMEVQQNSSYGPPEIGPEEIELVQVLGDGSFGTVYRGKCRKKDVAVKILHNQQLDQKTLQAFRKEVEIMSKIFHPNIVLFMGACTVPGHLRIVTELMPRGDVETMLKDANINLTLFTRMRMALDAALGMTWLHQSNPQIIHRDLKTANLLIDDNLTIKVCDFGLSQIKRRDDFLKDGQDGAKGTPLWMAPEVLMGQQFNEKCDVYSFGIVLWELTTRTEPFQEYNSFDTFRKDICLRKVRPPIPPDAHADVISLMKRCWDPNPSVRPSFGTIVQELENTLVDIAVRDEWGQRFWKENFAAKMQVSWSTFIKSFEYFVTQCNTLLIPPLSDHPKKEQLEKATLPQLEEFARKSPQAHMMANEEFTRRCTNPVYQQEQDRNQKSFKMVLAEVPASAHGIVITNEEEVVRLEKFGDVLAWFGPLVESQKGVVLMEKIRNLIKEPWFHGDISTPQSELLLGHKPNGTFLVRFSTSSPGAYTISRVGHTNGAISHHRIINQPGTGFLWNTKAYPSLIELMRDVKNELGLLYPAGGSKYQSIFAPSVASSGYVVEKK